MIHAKRKVVTDSYSPPTPETIAERDQRIIAFLQRHPNGKVGGMTDAEVQRLKEQAQFIGWEIDRTGRWARYQYQGPVNV